MTGTAAVMAVTEKGGCAAGAYTQEYAMEVTVQHLGGVQFEIQARQHTVFSDQPPENGGYDEGMTPPELFLASLGACAAYYVAEYLRQKGLASEGTRVKVVAEKVMNPPRIDNIRIEVELPMASEERDRAGVDRAVHRCLIHNTLMHPPKIEIAVHAHAAV
ncbi:MAG: OsmC family protein [Acidobacteriaceae bacterium]